MKYLLDANIFIEANNRYYSFNVCPGFWDWLVLEHGKGRLGSIDAVRRELLDADIAGWAGANRRFFAAADPSGLGRVATWVNGQSRLTPAAKTSFLECADAELVAHALARGLTVVTHEGTHPRSQARLFIPDACDALGIPHADTFQVLADLGARFVLDGVH